MRSVRFVMVAVLAVLLAASFASLATAQPLPEGITIAKETTNGDHTTKFDFTFTTPGGSVSFSIPGGDHVTEGPLETGTYTVVETVPSGWILRSILCGVVASVVAVGSFSVLSYAPQIDGSATVDLAHHSVTIEFVAGDIVVCTFTNDPAPAPVGGVVMPANTLALLSPWLVAIVLVGCIGSVVAVARKRWTWDQ